MHGSRVSSWSFTRALFVRWAIGLFESVVLLASQATCFAAPPCQSSRETSCAGPSTLLMTGIRHLVTSGSAPKHERQVFAKNPWGWEQRR